MRHYGLTLGYYPGRLWFWVPRVVRYGAFMDVFWGRLGLTVGRHGPDGPDPEILHELEFGSPDTPERRATFARADAAYRLLMGAEEETDCPGCGGPADNGFDRCVPPSPYFCTRCSAVEDANAVGPEAAITPREFSLWRLGRRDEAVKRFCDRTGLGDRVARGKLKALAREMA